MAERTADDLIRWLGAEHDRLIGSRAQAMSDVNRQAKAHKADALAVALAYIAVHWRPPAESAQEPKP